MTDEFSRENIKNKDNFMSMSFECEKCGKRYEVELNNVPEYVHCQHCGAINTITDEQKAQCAAAWTTRP